MNTITRLWVTGAVFASSVAVLGGGAEPAAASSAAPNFTPILPVRLMDSRPDRETIDGDDAAVGRRGAGSVYELQVTGRGGVPNDADAAMFNVIAEQPSAAGYVTVFQCGGTRPNASHVNYLAGQIVSNAAVSGFSADGTICLFTLAGTDLVVDVTGYSSNGGIVPFEPERVLETRLQPKFATFDGKDQHTGRVDRRSTYELQIAGRGSVPADARAAFLNVTAIRPDGAGYVTVFPCDEGKPEASHVSYLAGQISPNAVMAKLDGNGRICLFTLARTDLIVDVGGYSIDGVEPLTPSRLLDTRIGAKTSDGLHAGRGRVGAGKTYVLDVVGRGGLTNMSASAIINVTAVDPSANGYLTVYPCDRDRPNASNVNYFTGDVVPNAVLARIDTAGTICIFTLAATHLIVDVGGYSLLQAPEFRRNVLAADGGFACGIRSDGSVSCWGRQKPAETLEGEFDAVQVRHQAFGAETICGIEKISTQLQCVGTESDARPTGISLTDLAIGTNMACALTSDGLPLCWGSGANRGEPAPNVPLTVVAVGDAHSPFNCGVKVDQSLTCWGLEVGAPPVGTFLDVSVALQHACGLQTSGEVVCWNRSGAAVASPHGSFSAVDAKRWEACGIRDDGTLHCWIFSDSSKLKNFPDVRFKHFVSGGWYGCGIDVDDRVHCWGSDFFGGGEGAPTGPW